MPIKATQENIDELQKLCKNHVCAECGAFLKVSRLTGTTDYALICSQFENHNGVRRLEKDYALINMLNLKKGVPMSMPSMALQKLDEKGMMARIDKAKWPKELTLSDKQLIAKVSIEYGLDPLFGELMVYQGRPYVTIDARRRKAQETSLLDGINSRPATANERKERLTADKDYLFYCQVWVKGASHPFEGWGHVREKETKGSDFLPIVNDPMAMAEKRAEAQALRRAFHIPLPSVEDIIEGEFLEVKVEAPEPSVKKPAAPPSQGEKTSQGGDHPTQAQINKLWATAGNIGWKQDEVHDLVSYLYHVKSVKELSVSQMDTLIKRVEKAEGLTEEQRRELSQ